MPKVFRMKWLTNKWIRKWLRILHRDLGYFLVGITIVYSISGIILNHKKQGVDPAYKTVLVQDKFENSLTVDRFAADFGKSYPEYTINKVLPQETGYQLFLKGGVGFYNYQSGELWFEFYKKKPVIFFFNKLHYNQKKFWTTPSDIFAGALIFLAISGLIMVRGKNGFARRGAWFALAGILFVVVYIWL
ncbi:peptidase [Saccharicrinis sp. FJH2]|uniref:peptidase n=1 Tax=Saccharicrinis sp. FJH65 TaxID=3344659 RepID=UPI0035F3B7BF